MRGSSTGRSGMAVIVMLARPICWRVPFHQYINKPKVELHHSSSGISWRPSAGKDIRPCPSAEALLRRDTHGEALGGQAEIPRLTCRREAAELQRWTARASSSGRGSPQESGTTTSLRSRSAVCAQSIGYVGTSPERMGRTVKGPCGGPVLSAICRTAVDVSTQLGLASRRRRVSPWAGRLLPPAAAIGASSPPRSGQPQ